MVEALTIVLAVGVTRGWRSALEGAALAVLLLAVVVAVAGSAIVRWVPLDLLRLVVGVLLLIFGLQWLRKAILRSAGHIPLHDEDAIYRREVERLRSTGRAPGRDPVGFTVAFKGVLLEGTEVVVIVITLGAAGGHLPLAVAAAFAAVLVVGLTGLAVRRRLAEVPENTMKLAVGVMLTSFGTFWMGEGAGVVWPGADLSILGLIAAFAGFALVTAWALGRTRVPNDAERR